MDFPREPAHRLTRRALAASVLALVAFAPGAARAQDEGAPAAPVDPGPATTPVTPAAPATPALSSVERHAPPPESIQSIPFSLVPHSREGLPLQWDPSRRRFQMSDWFVTAAGAGVALTSAIVKPAPAPWRGGILFDEEARNALRMRSEDSRGFARDTSDVLISLSVMGPFLIDVLVTAWWYRGSKDVAQEMALIDLETLAIAAAVHGTISTFAGRERPYGRTCGGELPENSLDCDTFGRYRSYFSGHTVLAFTSASLVCTHHLNLRLFESGPTDVLACASSMATAAATGAGRILGDQHYSTDVLTGAVVGLGIGFGVPYFLHYRRGATPGADAVTGRRGDFTIHLVPTGTGASAVGTF